MVSMIVVLALAAGATGATTTATTSSTSSLVFDISELDSKTLPCSDLNGFVNANWLAANPIPKDQTRWGTWDKLSEDSLNTQRDIVEAAAKNSSTAESGSIEQQIGYLYAAGMDTAAIERAGFTPIKPKLDAIASIKRTQDVVAYLTKSFADGDMEVFDFGPFADFKNAKMQIAYTEEAGLGLPTKDYYFDPKYKDIRDAYLEHIAKALQLTGVSGADANKQAHQVLAFETELARVSLTPVERRNPENIYHFVSVREADKITPHLRWEDFMKAQGVTVDKGFSLSQPKFMAEVDRLLASAPIDQWQSYLRFHVIHNASPFLSKAFQDNWFEFYGKTLTGQPEKEPRWKRVLGGVNDSMGEALGQLYVAKVFQPESKRRAQELVAHVLDALKVRIQNVDWMSDETKAKAIAKWKNFLPRIGYPDKWRDWSDLDIKQGDYYGDVMAAAKFNYQYDLHKIGKATDRQEWSMTPQTVNAVYFSSSNTITFAAAILQPPFFYPNGDDAINYGAIGALIGHEASHGFDDKGSQFDGDGNLANWWTKDDRQKFEIRADRLVQQFNDYAPIKNVPDAHVNGRLTLGENIADLGGLSVAYDALQQALKQNPRQAGEKIGGYTQDQRLFLSWARLWRGSVRDKEELVRLNTDPHPPDSLRAIGAPSNMDAFARAFQCKPGDAMVRSGDKQAKIW